MYASPKLIGKSDLGGRSLMPSKKINITERKQ
jgi:hypothetical protein